MNTERENINENELSQPEKEKESTCEDEQIKKQKEANEKFYAKIILYCVGGFILFYYIFAFFDFIPFIADDLTNKVIPLCSMLVCAVVAGCTCLIINEIRKLKQ